RPSVCVGRFSSVLGPPADLHSFPTRRSSDLGLHARVTFLPARELGDRQMLLARVEEGRFEEGEWQFERVWNGDQTDWGLNFSGQPHLLKVRLATYETGNR